MAKRITKVFGLDPVFPALGLAILTAFFPVLSAVWVAIVWVVIFRGPSTTASS
jgi:hypothetical protein